MTTSLRDAFDLTADRYDQARRQLVPCFDDFYRNAVELLPFKPADAIAVLDLGAGTGLLSACIAQAFPRARLTLVDLADNMLERARERFAGRPEVRFVTADFAAALPVGNYDAIVSALAIHHLEDERKRQLFREIYRALEAGGVFVNADQVAGPTAAADRRYHEAWRAQVRARGVTGADLAAALARMKFDRTAPVAAQLEWLTAAGFADADCAYKDGMFAVLSGAKA